GDLDLNAISIDLEKLTIGVPIKTPSDLSSYNLDLGGMSVTSHLPDITIEGGFLKNETVDPVEYDGTLSIQAAVWGIMALGSFASVDGHPSMFIYGALNGPIGGPEFFFLTGLAFGFGYNHKLNMPAMDQVHNFPLVKSVVDPPAEAEGVEEMLTAIARYIPPELGEYWVAAGVKWTSFELLDGFALLTLQFGQEVELGVLGVLSLELPKPVGEIKAYVNVELDMEVIFQPDAGVLQASAVLSENAYIIDKDCKLTGGFAYYQWFKGEHNGEFVVTLGGYHPHFFIPSYYPRVSRLGINWPVSDKIDISGGAYFALTPSCVMAGVHMHLAYASDSLKAWLDAKADFLIFWKPFHYDIELSVNIGASYTISVGWTKTYTLSMNVDVHIWGPKFAGKAKINWTVISFSISFGADTQPNTTQLIDWDTFQQSFLPLQDDNTDNHETPTPILQLAMVEHTATQGSNSVVKINYNAGVSNTFEDLTDQAEYWIVEPSTFSFNTTTAIPASQLSFVKGPNTVTNTPFGLKPLGSLTLENEASDHQLGILKWDHSSNAFKPFNFSNWQIRATTKKAPEALWGTVNNGAETPSSNTVADINNGLSAVSPPATSYVGPAAFSLVGFYDNQNSAYTLPLRAGRIESTTLPYAGALNTIANTLNDATVSANRSKLLSDIETLGATANQDDALADLATEVSNFFQGSPMLTGTGPRRLPRASRRLRQLRERVKLAPSQAVSLPPQTSTSSLQAGPQLISSSIHYQRAHAGSTHATHHALAHQRSKGSQLILRAHSDHPRTRVEDIRVRPGQTHTWSLGQHQGMKLRYQGRIGLRAIAFDRHRRVIWQQLFFPGKIRTIQLPEEAQELVLHGLSRMLHQTDIRGWHQDHVLRTVHPQTLIGKGVLIHPQHPHRIGKRQFSRDRGMASGHEVIQKNTQMRSDGSKVPGFITTRFAAQVKTVYLLGQSIDQPNQLAHFADHFDCRVIYQNENGEKHAESLHLVALGVQKKYMWGQFHLPGSAVQSEDFLVWVQPKPTFTLHGIAGAHDDRFGWTARHLTNLISSVSHFAIHDDPKDARVQLIAES
ncbi:MAG: DUF6603 domain-containing protein, partial [Bacteroidota bacterium]